MKKYTFDYLNSLSETELNDLAKKEGVDNIPVDEESEDFKNFLVELAEHSIKSGNIKEEI